MVECSLLEIFLPQPDRDNLSAEGWTRWAPEMPPNLDFPLILKMPGVLLWHFFLPSLFKNTNYFLKFILNFIILYHVGNLIIKRKHLSTNWTNEHSSALSQTFYKLILLTEIWPRQEALMRCGFWWIYFRWMDIF